MKYTSISAYLAIRIIGRLHHLTPIWWVKTKESVESLVYLTIGFGKPENK